MTTVSIIIPVFQDFKGILRCLQALSEQTYPTQDYEVIVVDNGSTPPIRIRDNYPFRLYLIRCETPGSYAARNAGAAVATGDVFAFTDADCVPSEHWLQRGVASLVSEDGKRAVGGNVAFPPMDSPSGVALYQIAMGFGQEINIRDKGFSATANLFCTRTQFETVGPFDERLLSGGDLEWAWRAISYQIRMKYEPDAVVHTDPRSNLRGAIRQARRVAAGRMELRRLGLAHLGEAAVAKHRSAWQATPLILTNRQLGIWDKARVLIVATLIRAATALEAVRLALGAKAERR